MLCAAILLGVPHFFFCGYVGQRSCPQSHREGNGSRLGSRVRRAHEPAGKLYSYLQRGLGNFCALRAFCQAQRRSLNSAWLLI